MSLGSRIAIALFALLGTGLFGFMGFNAKGVPAPPVAFFGMSLFCLIIAVACLVEKLRGPALRIIGATIFVVFGFYVFDSVGTDNLLRSIAGLVLIGIPCGVLAVTGKYPDWGKFGAAFSKKDESQNRESGVNGE